MYKFNKKRIDIIALAIIVSVTAFSFKTAENNNNEIENTKQVAATPISSRTIIVDSGHGQPDGGAVSSNGIFEEDINLKIALKLQNILEANGTTVILTRSDENSICDIDSKTLRQKKVSDLKNRVKIGNNSSADAFVSIHLNKISNQNYNGWQCFFKKNDDSSKKLAMSIQKGMNETIQKQNDRVPMKIDNTYLVKNVQIPITIVECGFLSNPEEEKQLQQDEYQNKLAWGIYVGLNEYIVN